MMEWYHIVMGMQTESKGRMIYLLSLDKTEKEVRYLADALIKRRELVFEGERIYPPQVHRVSFFRTSKPAAELTLPKGRSIADYKNSKCKPIGCCKHRYIARCLEKGKIMEVNDCTGEFVIGNGSRNKQKKI